MEDRELIEKIRSYKEEHGYTLHGLSKRTDVHVATLERWFKTGRINKMYAKFVKEKIGLE